MTLRAWLIDLDDTLLDLDSSAFAERHIKAFIAYLLAHAPDAKIDYRDAIRRTLDGATSSSDAQYSNHERLNAAFAHMVNMSADDITALSEQFYANEFHKLKENARPLEDGKALIEAARQSGCSLVLATNPIFPKTATLARMEWAGLDPTDFILLTTVEEMHFLKPDPAYYEEILALIDMQPDEVLMIGDTLEHDILPASRIGIRALWWHDNRRETLLKLLNEGAPEEAPVRKTEVPALRAQVAMLSRYEQQLTSPNALIQNNLMEWLAGEYLYAKTERSKISSFGVGRVARISTLAHIERTGESSFPTSLLQARVAADRELRKAVDAHLKTEASLSYT